MFFLPSNASILRTCPLIFIFIACVFLPRNLFISSFSTTVRDVLFPSLSTLDAFECLSACDFSLISNIFRSTTHNSGILFSPFSWTSPFLFALAASSAAAVDVCTSAAPTTNLYKIYGPDVYLYTECSFPAFHTIAATTMTELVSTTGNSSVTTISVIGGVVASAQGIRVECPLVDTGDRGPLNVTVRAVTFLQDAFMWVSGRIPPNSTFFITSNSFDVRRVHGSNPQKNLIAAILFGLRPNYGFNVDTSSLLLVENNFISVNVSEAIAKNVITAAIAAIGSTISITALGVSPQAPNASFIVSQNTMLIVEEEPSSQSMPTSIINSAKAHLAYFQIQNQNGFYLLSDGVLNISGNVMRGTSSAPPSGAGGISGLPPLRTISGGSTASMLTINSTLGPLRISSSGDLLVSNNIIENFRSFSSVSVAVLNASSGNANSGDLITTEDTKIVVEGNVIRNIYSAENISTLFMYTGALKMTTLRGVLALRVRNNTISNCTTSRSVLMYRQISRGYAVPPTTNYGGDLSLDLSQNVIRDVVGIADDDNADDVDHSAGYSSAIAIGMAYFDVSMDFRPFSTISNNVVAALKVNRGNVFIAMTNTPPDGVVPYSLQVNNINFTISGNTVQSCTLVESDTSSSSSASSFFIARLEFPLIAIAPTSNTVKPALTISDNVVGGINGSTGHRGGQGLHVYVAHIRSTTDAATSPSPTDVAGFTLDRGGSLLIERNAVSSVVAPANNANSNDNSEATTRVSLVNIAAADLLVGGLARVLVRGNVIANVSLSRDALGRAPQYTTTLSGVSFSTATFCLLRADARAEISDNRITAIASDYDLHVPSSTPSSTLATTVAELVHVAIGTTMVITDRSSVFFSGGLIDNVSNVYSIICVSFTVNGNLTVNGTSTLPMLTFANNRIETAEGDIIRGVEVSVDASEVFSAAPITSYSSVQIVDNLIEDTVGFGDVSALSMTVRTMRILSRGLLNISGNAMRRLENSFSSSQTSSSALRCVLVGLHFEESLLLSGKEAMLIVRGNAANHVSAPNGDFTAVRVEGSRGEGGRLEIQDSAGLVIESNGIFDVSTSPSTSPSSSSDRASASRLILVSAPSLNISVNGSILVANNSIGGESTVTGGFAHFLFPRGLSLRDGSNFKTHSNRVVQNFSSFASTDLIPFIGSVLLFRVNQSTIDIQNSSSISIAWNHFEIVRGRFYTDNVSSSSAVIALHPSSDGAVSVGAQSSIRIESNTFNVDFVAANDSSATAGTWRSFGAASASGGASHQIRAGGGLVRIFGTILFSSASTQNPPSTNAFVGSVVFQGNVGSLLTTSLSATASSVGCPPALFGILPPSPQSAAIATAAADEEQQPTRVVKGSLVIKNNAIEQRVVEPTLTDYLAPTPQSDVRTDVSALVCPVTFVGGVVKAVRDTNIVIQTNTFWSNTAQTFAFGGGVIAGNGSLFAIAGNSMRQRIPPTPPSSTSSGHRSLPAIVSLVTVSGAFTLLAGSEVDLTSNVVATSDYAPDSLPAVHRLLTVTESAAGADGLSAGGGLYAVNEKSRIRICANRFYGLPREDPRVLLESRLVDAIDNLASSTTTPTTTTKVLEHCHISTPSRTATLSSPPTPSASVYDRMERFRTPTATDVEVSPTHSGSPSISPSGDADAPSATPPLATTRTMAARRTLSRSPLPSPSTQTETSEPLTTTTTTMDTTDAPTTTTDAYTTTTTAVTDGTTTAPTDPTTSASPTTTASYESTTSAAETSAVTTSQESTTTTPMAMFTTTDGTTTAPTASSITSAIPTTTTTMDTTDGFTTTTAAETTTTTYVTDGTTTIDPTDPTTSALPTVTESCESTTSAAESSVVTTSQESTTTTAMTTTTPTTAATEGTVTATAPDSTSIAILTSTSDDAVTTAVTTDPSTTMTTPPQVSNATTDAPTPTPTGEMCTQEAVDAAIASFPWLQSSNLPSVVLTEGQIVNGVSRLNITEFSKDQAALFAIFFMSDGQTGDNSTTALLSTIRCSPLRHRRLISIGGNAKGFAADTPSEVSLHFAVVGAAAVVRGGGALPSLLLSVTALPRYEILEDEALDLYIPLGAVVEAICGVPSSPLAPLPQFLTREEYASDRPLFVGSLRVTPSVDDNILNAPKDTTTVVSGGGTGIGILVVDGGLSAELQGLSAAAMMTCADPHTRAAFGSFRSLSPFAIEDSYIGVVAGNFAFLAGVFVLQTLVLLALRLWKRVRRWEELSAKARFPAILLNCSFSIHTGTAYAASQLVSLPDRTDADRAVGYLALIFTLLYPVGLIGFAYKFVGRAYQSYAMATFLTERQWPSWLTYVLPQGTIYAVETRHTFGALISQYRLPQHFWPSYPTWTPLIFAIGGLFHPDTIPKCQALFACMGITFVLCCAVILYRKPRRSNAANWLDGLAKALSAVVLFCMAAAVDTTIDDGAWAASAAVAVLTIGYLQTSLTILRMIYSVFLSVFDKVFDRFVLTQEWVHYTSDGAKTAKRFGPQGASEDVLLGEIAGRRTAYDDVDAEGDEAAGLVCNVQRLRGGDAVDGEQGLVLPAFDDDLDFDADDADAAEMVDLAGALSSPSTPTSFAVPPCVRVGPLPAGPAIPPATALGATADAALRLSVSFSSDGSDAHELQDGKQVVVASAVSRRRESGRKTSDSANSSSARLESDGGKIVFSFSSCSSESLGLGRESVSDDEYF